MPDGGATVAWLNSSIFFFSLLDLSPDLDFIPFTKSSSVSRKRTAKHWITRNVTKFLPFPDGKLVSCWHNQFSSSVHAEGYYSSAILLEVIVKLDFHCCWTVHGKIQKILAGIYFSELFYWTVLFLENVAGWFLNQFQFFCFHWSDPERGFSWSADEFQLRILQLRTSPLFLSVWNVQGASTILLHRTFFFSWATDCNRIFESSLEEHQKWKFRLKKVRTRAKRKNGSIRLDAETDSSKYCDLNVLS